MMNKMSVISYFVLAAMSPSIIETQAEILQETQHHHHEAHVHGTWEFFAALDDHQLAVTIKGPLVDVIGFEHPPTDEKEYQAVRKLKASFEKSDLLFYMNDRAKCTLTEPVRVVLPEGFSDELNDDKGHHGDDHKHEDHDDDDHGHTIEHNHDEESHAAESHGDDHVNHSSDLEADYMFTCQAPKNLRTITMVSFDTFPAIENIDAVFLGDAKQVAQRLERGSRTLKIN